MSFGQSPHKMEPKDDMGAIRINADDPNFSLDPDLNDNFEETKFRIRKNTKDVVNKIFKAAWTGNQTELDQLFNKVENRAKRQLRESEMRTTSKPISTINQSKPISALTANPQSSLGFASRNKVSN